MKKILLISSIASQQLFAGPPSSGIDQFGNGNPIYQVIATTNDGLNVPRDLAFNPAHPDQLWIANRADDSITLVFDAGTANQKTEWRKDPMAYHFMEEVSSLSFGTDNTFATCQESRNTYDHMAKANNFMGPALWPADLDIFAKIDDPDLLGSHLDMLHQSPDCMGIAHQSDNKYWVFDGYHGIIAYYDFQKDHGPGHDDHSDGIVRMYTDIPVKRVENIPSHMIIDKNSGWLYVADTGNNRVIRINTQTGAKVANLRLNMEYLAEFSAWNGAEVELIATGLGLPSGIALSETMLFVGDAQTGEIIAYDLLSKKEIGRLSTGLKPNALMGLEVGPEGRLWFVDAIDNEVVKIIPQP